MRALQRCTRRGGSSARRRAGPRRRRTGATRPTKQEFDVPEACFERALQQRAVTDVSTSHATMTGDALVKLEPRPYRTESVSWYVRNSHHAAPTPVAQLLNLPALGVPVTLPVPSRS